MSKPFLTRRNIAVLLVVVLAASVVLYLRYATPIVEMGGGTIRSLDLASRRATLEVILPATGATRQLEGEVPVGCKIEINGKPANLEDLRVGDTVQVRARIDRSRDPDGHRRAKFTAEHVRCTRMAVAGR
jgi:hypothetical protein